MSYLDWKVGDRIACVSLDGLRTGIPGELNPTVGSVYTIRTIEPDQDRVYVRLVEIVNPVLYYKDGPDECDYPAKWFRRVQPRKTDISVFTRLLTHPRVTIGEDA